MRRSFRREMSALDAVFAFIRESLDAPGPPPADPFLVDLVVEELFTNVVKYQPQGHGSVDIEIERLGDRVRIVLRDEGGDPFDIGQAAPVEVDAPLAERRIGGLGIHFVRQVAEDITCAHDGTTNTISLTIPLRTEVE